MKMLTFEFLWFNLLVSWFDRINSLDMPTAVMYLRESDPNMQVLGAAYIQHECYNNSEAKDEVLEADCICGQNSSVFPLLATGC